MKHLDAISGSLPEGWGLATVGDLCDQFGGEVQTGPFGSQLHAEDYVEDGVPCIMPKDIVDDRISEKTIARVSVSNAERLAIHQLRVGDVVYARRGDIGRRALISEREAGWLCGTGCLRIRLNCPHILPEYLVAFLGHPRVRAWVEHRAQGATLLNLNTSILRGVPLRIPPKKEQRRIADILDKADAIRRKRKEAIALTEELLRSAFLEMFGDPVTNPKGWASRRLGEVIERFDAGWSANGEPRTHMVGEYGVLKVSAVSSGTFRPEEHKAVMAAAIDRELVTPKRGDLLFSRANTRELVAACCLVESDQPDLFLPDKLWRIVPRANVATSPYLRFLFGGERFRAELAKYATGTSGSMLNVSMEKVRTMMAPIHPFKDQQRFSEFVWRVLEAQRHLHVAELAADELFVALVQQAFRGELSVSVRTPDRQLDLFAGKGA
jgi:type I restriction enzyme, S subunit